MTRRDLARTLCEVLGDFRRSCHLGEAGDTLTFAPVLDMIESVVSVNLSPTTDAEDANVFRAIARFRRALLDGGLSETDRMELAGPDGFLDQVEAYLLQVLSPTPDKEPTT
jgi:hypothetical protein